MKKYYYWLTEDFEIKKGSLASDGVLVEQLRGIDYVNLEVYCSKNIEAKRIEDLYESFEDCKQAAIEYLAGASEFLQEQLEKVKKLEEPFNQYAEMSSKEFRQFSKDFYKD